MAQARSLKISDLKAFAESVANRRPLIIAEEAKAVLEIAQAIDAEIRDAANNAILGNQRIILRVLGEQRPPIELKDGAGAVLAVINMDNIDPEIKANDASAQRTKLVAICPSRDKLLGTWIKSLSVDDNTIVNAALVAEAKAENNAEMAAALRTDAGANKIHMPYGVEIAADVFGNLAVNQTNDAHKPSKQAAQAKITEILEKRLSRLTEPQLDKLNEVIARKDQAKATDVNKADLLAALNDDVVKGNANAANITATTLTEKQFTKLVAVAEKRAKQLVQDKVLGVPAAIADVNAGNDAKNAYQALLTVSRAGTAAELGGKVGDLKLGFTAAHVAGLGAEVYKEPEIKKDASTALMGLMTKLVKEHNEFNTDAKITAMRAALADQADKVAAINALEPFQTWGAGGGGAPALEAAELTQPLEAALNKALLDRENSLKVTRDLTDRNNLSIAGQEFNNLYTLLSTHTSSIGEKLGERGLELTDVLPEVLKSSDLLNARKALIDLGVPKDAPTLNQVASEIVEERHQEIKASADLKAASKSYGRYVGTAPLESAREAAESMKRREEKRSHDEKHAGVLVPPQLVVPAPGELKDKGTIAVSAHLWLNTSNYMLGASTAPARQAFRSAKGQNWRSVTGIGKGLGFGALGVVGGTLGLAATAVGTSVVGAAAVMLDVGEGLRAAIAAPISSIKQSGVAGARLWGQEFDDIDKTLASLQSQIETAKGSRDPIIQAELSNSLEHVLARLETAKKLYEEDKKSTLGKMSKTYNRYERLSSGCDARIRKITGPEGLQHMLKTIKPEPEGKDEKGQDETYKFREEVIAVQLNDNAAIQEAVNKLYGVEVKDPNAVVFGEAGDPRMLGKVSKKDFKDANKGLLTRVMVAVDRGDGTTVTLNSKLLTTQTNGKALTTISNTDSKGDTIPPGRNPYRDMPKDHWAVISWAAQAVDTHLKFASDKTGIKIRSTAGLTEEQIAALFIYCARMGKTCEPKGLYDVTDKEMERGKKEQLQAIDRHFAGKKLEEIPSGPAVSQPDIDAAMEKRLGELADRAKYYGPKEMTKFVEASTDKRITSLRGPGRSGGG